jgi:hypothetical protein
MVGKPETIRFNQASDIAWPGRLPFTRLAGGD